MSQFSELILKFLLSCIDWLSQDKPYLPLTGKTDYGYFRRLVAIANLTFELCIVYYIMVLTKNAEEHSAIRI